MPHTSRRWVALCVVAACSSSPGDTAEDAGDTAEDAGGDTAEVGAPYPPRERGSCEPCRADADCGTGLACVVEAGGASFCLRRCDGDGACVETPVPATCEHGTGVCAPSGGSCVASEVGSRCDAGCRGRFGTCAAAEGDRYCTGACVVDADCPLGFRRCREVDGARVCVRDADLPADRCALAEASAPEAACVPVPETTVSTPECVATLPGLDPLGGAALPDCACRLTDTGALLDQAATALGRTRCALGFPTALLDEIRPTVSHDPFRLGWTGRVHGDWTAAPRFAALEARALDEAAAEGLGELLRIAARTLDVEAQEPRSPRAHDLAAELAALALAAGGTADADVLRPSLAWIPSTLAEALAAVVAALARALAARDEAVRTLTEAERSAFFDGAASFLLDDLPPLDPSDPRAAGVLRGDVDVAHMIDAAIPLAAALEAVPPPAGPAPRGELVLDTPRGRIAIRGGAGSDTYEGSGWDTTLLLVELGGDDVYRFPAGATSAPGQGVGVVLDLGGDDTYAYPEAPVASDEGPAGHARLLSDHAGRQGGAAPRSRSTAGRQGAGLLGIGVLADRGAGRDTYRSHRRSHGAGVLGVGVLLDDGGDDTYAAEALAQGAGAFGLGLLVDRGGQDRYTAYHLAQGFGYVRSAGILWDGGEGDDVYLLVPGDPLYPSAQDPARNMSGGQGFGFGRRADAAPDGVFMSGGLGVLRDQGGSDSYSAGVFAQGAAYWYGTGVLADGSGSDRYAAHWYGQGAAAHFGTAILLESSGDDRYNVDAPPANAVLGAGHDFGVAWLVDLGGADTYAAPGLSLGAGNDSGAGFFADGGGSDTYSSTSDFSFGSADLENGEDAFRVRAGTVGVFLDADGDDTYARPTLGGLDDDASSLRTMHEGARGEAGVGIDASGARLGL